MEERRSQRRFNLKLTCLMRVCGSEEPMRCEMVTENISAGGAYFYTVSPLAVGVRLSMQIMIQRTDRSGSSLSGACVSICGEVLRVDVMGMAVEFDDQYRIFRRPTPTDRRIANYSHGAGFNVDTERPAPVQAVYVTEQQNAR